jgi:4-hydroxy-2-oxoheptanedioate aldolase
MYPNPLKQKIHSGDLVLGTFLPGFTPHIAGVIIATNPEFLWIDTEHAPYGVEALDVIPVMARNKGVAPMIRVAWNDPTLIKKAYDAGAVAVMVPQVDTAEDAARAVHYAKYPPEGNRGLTPSWTRVAGEDFGHVIRTANEETVVVLQVESRQAFDNLEDMAKVPGVDVLFVGPLDLSASVGTITETNSEEVREIMKEVPRMLSGTPVSPGTTCADVADAQEKIGWGYRYVSVGNALNAGAQLVKTALETVRDGASDGS